MKTIDLRSDTVTKPSPAMRKAMCEAEVGDDVLGEDPTARELQDATAMMLGMEDALFVPSGTMGNQLAIKTHTHAGNEVICEADSHIVHYEAGASGMLSGVQLKTLPGQRGVLTAAQIEEAINADGDIHHAPTRLIALENTHNRAGGTIYPLGTMHAIRQMAAGFGIPMHLDGARLLNACVATNTKPHQYAANFDSVSLCFSKGLGAPAGSVLAGRKDYITRARYYRKAFGGGMRQVGILAAGALYALRHNLDRLAEDHDKAQRLAQAIAGMKAFSIDLDAVQTNIVIFEIVRPSLSAHTVVSHLEELGILSIAFSNKRVRFVTHMDVSMADIDDAITLMKKHYSAP